MLISSWSDTAKLNHKNSASRREREAKSPILYVPAFTVCISTCLCPPNDVDKMLLLYYSIIIFTVSYYYNSANRNRHNGLIDVHKIKQ